MSPALPAAPLRAAVLALLLAACPNGAPAQQPGPAPSWSEVKCERYRKAYAEAIRRFGTDGLGSAFLARHDAFLASGCATPPDVCPRSEAELRLANALVVAGLNAGMSGTFMPFACR